MLDDLKKALAERMLNAEMDQYLGRESEQVAEGRASYVSGRAKAPSTHRFHATGQPEKNKYVRLERESDALGGVHAALDTDKFGREPQISSDEKSCGRTDCKGRTAYDRKLIKAVFHNALYDIRLLARDRRAFGFIVPLTAYAGWAQWPVQ